MLNKIKSYLAKRKQLKAEMQYYKLLGEGGLFIQYIHSDLEAMKQRNYNRDQRRRFEKQLKQDGKFSSEMVDYYINKVDVILEHLKKGAK